MLESRQTTLASVNEFRRARRKAAWQRIASTLSGRSEDLLEFDQVRTLLRARQGLPPQLRDIPLDAIVGSVGRYTDFTRTFLPLSDSDQSRWVGVSNAMTGLTGLPPITVYQIGEAYFVLDGNHRVSVARQLGTETIEAYVTTLVSAVPLESGDNVDDIILKAEYADFLEITHIDILRPDSELLVTAPGKFSVLHEHIEVHRHYMGLELQREIPYEEAVSHWYDMVYQPVVDAISALDGLAQFPERTATDLYLWLAEHRADLAEMVGWEVDPEVAAGDLVAHLGSDKTPLDPFISSRVSRIAETSDDKDSDEPTSIEQPSTLFNDVMVAVTGEQDGWAAVHQAVWIAQAEEGRLLGLHVLVDPDTDQASLKEQFNQIAAEYGVEGTFSVREGKILPWILNAARASDLIVVRLSHPPGTRTLSRMSSGFRALIKRSPRPILAVPTQCHPVNHVLVAYDGGVKAKEALIAATYMSLRWDVELAVLAADSTERMPAPLLEAEDHLARHGVVAKMIVDPRPPAEAITAWANKLETQMVAMGGYGRTGLAEMILGGYVDEVLQHAQWSVLICQ
ncbi:MAG: universal stress protein [Chloroflexota bacterium]